jgi:hypothetical protein
MWFKNITGILKVRFKNTQDLGSNQSKDMGVRWEKWLSLSEYVKEIKKGVFSATVERGGGERTEDRRP